jgi:vancomycin resistance protein VanJ
LIVDCIPVGERSRCRVVAVAVAGYSAIIVGLWLSVRMLTDRVWLATLLAFGPRWLSAVPLVPLAWLAASARPRRAALLLIGVLALTGCLLMVGLLDFRLGLQRAPGPPALRLLIQNLGGSGVTAAAFDQFLRSEGVDVAALQECPFYDNGPAGLGWHFYYGGDLCLVSRFPFTVLDVADPDNAWRHDSREPVRFAIDGPMGRFQLLNVHFETIRGGLEALGTAGWSAAPRFVRNRDESMRQSHDARERAGRVTEALLVVGDFNLPVESAIYRQNWGGFENAFSSCGRGFGHTKFTRAFGIRIDHVLASAQWACVDARVLSSPYGGDHAPLVADLRFR